MQFPCIFHADDWLFNQTAFKKKSFCSQAPELRPGFIYTLHMYNIWQDAGNRTRVAASAARCATNELHTSLNELHTSQPSQPSYLITDEEKQLLPQQLLPQQLITRCPWH